MTKKRKENNSIFNVENVLNFNDENVQAFICVIISLMFLGYLFYSFNKEEEFHDVGTYYGNPNSNNPFEQLILVPPQDDSPFDGVLGGRIKK